MKKLLIGLVGIFSSVTLFGLTMVSVSIYSSVLTKGNIGWDTQLGPFGTAFKEIGIVPFTLCVLFFIFGAYYVKTGLKE